jgi:hypothetical protein
MPIEPGDADPIVGRCTDRPRDVRTVSVIVVSTLGAPTSHAGESV